ncbi:MAG: NVEALA domain-containing protein [Tannerella sp.]|jgi:hypothetical protein|nr:NVEALA domain-containing protein [Tannerella sp.]
MKNKIIYSFAVLVIATLTVWNIHLNSSSSKSELSDLNLSNVEALAQGEYPTLTCLSYCLWDPYYNCHVYLYNNFGMLIDYFTCTGYSGRS